MAIANDINIVPIKIELSFPFFAKHSSPFRVSEVPVDYNIKMMSEIDVESLKKEFSDLYKEIRISSEADNLREKREILEIKKSYFRNYKKSHKLTILRP